MQSFATFCTNLCLFNLKLLGMKFSSKLFIKKFKWDSELTTFLPFLYKLLINCFCSFVRLAIIGSLSQDHSGCVHWSTRISRVSILSLTTWFTLLWIGRGSVDQNCDDTESNDVLAAEKANEIERTQTMGTLSLNLENISELFVSFDFLIIITHKSNTES